MIAAKDIEDALQPVLGSSQVTIDLSVSGRDANGVVVISIDHDSPEYSDPHVITVPRGALEKTPLDKFVRWYLTAEAINHAQSFAKLNDKPGFRKLPERFSQSLRGKPQRGPRT